MTEGRENLIQLSLDRAYETLQEAQLLAQTRHPSGAANRVYYACFYAVTALLMTKDITSSKHGGVIALFNRHYPNRAGQVLFPGFRSETRKRLCLYP